MVSVRVSRECSKVMHFCHRLGQSAAVPEKQLLSRKSSAATMQTLAESGQIDEPAFMNCMAPTGEHCPR
jgi:hypothetical protein